MNLTCFFLLTVYFLSFFNISYSSSYSLCNSSYVFCVQVNTSFPCSNCNRTTIQGVIDGLDSSGNYTIYLVGSPSILTIFEESVNIDVSTPEDIFLANTIKPYPGHSIRWMNSGNNRNLEIHSFWWRITGDGGYLEFGAYDLDDYSTMIDLTGGGGLLDNFELVNDYLENCFCMVRFETGSCSEFPVCDYCKCDGDCVDSSFTDNYGYDKRIWIKNNTFEIAAFSVIDGSPLDYTIEDNYFFSGPGKQVNYFLNSNSECQDGYFIKNNIFHLSLGLSGGACIMKNSYKPLDFHFQYGKSLIFNNLIVDEGNYLSCLIRSSGDDKAVAERIYIYNNLFQTVGCFLLGSCQGDGRSVNLYFHHNLGSESCGTTWGVFSCNSSLVLTDLGDNTDGTVIPFVGSGDKPYPFFDLTTEIIGMSWNDENPNNLALPDYDFIGRPRPGNDLLNRSTIGPFEYQCPYECLSGQRIYCQKDNCECLETFFGKYSCEHFINSSLCPSCVPDGGVCNVNGSKESNYYHCDCFEGYHGEFCEYRYCYGVSSSNESQSCGVHGNCTSPNHCECFGGDYYGSRCNITVCNEYLQNDTLNVCSGHGECVSYNNCKCHNFSELYFGEFCEFHFCYGYLNNDTSNVCTGHGNCMSYNNCSCVDNYTHHSHNIIDSQNDCSSWECFGHWYNQTNETCSGHGNCTSPNHCECFGGYSEDPVECSIWDCYEFTTAIEHKDLVCSGHGVCVDINTCNCDKEPNIYDGDECEVWTCFGIIGTDKQGCSNHGSCISFDICECDAGYNSTGNPDTYPCDTWKCNGKKVDDQSDISSICNRRGSCVSPDKCDCANNYEGNDCETWSCGFFYDNPAACSGHGKCEGPNICECTGLYSGKLCSTNDAFLYIGAPSLGLFGLILLLAMLILLCCFLCTSILCAFGMLLVFIIFTSFSLVVFVQMKKMRRFQKLKHFDVLLHEQELEDDDSIAHLSVNKSLFEVKYSEIKILTILGEGGSSSVVYKAKWKNQ